MTELGYRLRESFRRHIRQQGSVDEAARSIGIGRSTLYQYLAGTTDPGLDCVLGWADKVGLDGKTWIQSTGLYPQLGPYSDRLLGALALDTSPTDPLVRSCSKLAEKLYRRPMTPDADLASKTLRLLIGAEDVHLKDAEAARQTARSELQSALAKLRRSSPEALPEEDIARFFAWVATYGYTSFSKNAAQEWAWCLFLSLGYFERSAPNPVLTWLLMDSSMLLRRSLKGKEALELASLAVAVSVRQETTRLYPRALFTLASILFYAGDQKEAGQVYGLALQTPSAHPYKPIVAHSLAVSLAEERPQEALKILRDHRDALDSLPPARQLKRHWTEARVLSQVGRDDEAFEAYSEAFAADVDACDVRDLFLIFEEARLLALPRGDFEGRLAAMAEVLWKHLERLSYHPGAFLVAKGYLDFLAAQNAAGMARQIRRLKAS